MQFVGDRDPLTRLAESLGPEGTLEARKQLNRESLGGLPGLRFD